MFQKINVTAGTRPRCPQVLFVNVVAVTDDFLYRIEPFSKAATMLSSWSKSQAGQRRVERRVRDRTL